jgi:hypothetical protein
MKLPSKLAILASWLVAGATVNAQTASKSTRDETVLLSPFEVRSTSDSGYNVTDTNSALKIAVDAKHGT